MLYFTSEAQVRLYRSTVVALLKFPLTTMRTAEAAQVVSTALLCIKSVLCVHVFQMVENFDQKTRKGRCCECPAREQYNKEYEDEIRLNEEFNRFVANFQLAYEGPNTAHAQIGAKYETRELVLCLRMGS